MLFVRTNERTKVNECSATKTRANAAPPVECLRPRAVLVTQVPLMLLLRLRLQRSLAAKSSAKGAQHCSSFSCSSATAALQRSTRFWRLQICGQNLLLFSPFHCSSILFSHYYPFSLTFHKLILPHNTITTTTTTTIIPLSIRPHFALPNLFIHTNTNTTTTTTTTTQMKQA